MTDELDHLARALKAATPAPDPAARARALAAAMAAHDALGDVREPVAVSPVRPARSWVERLGLKAWLAGLSPAPLAMGGVALGALVLGLGWMRPAMDLVPVPPLVIEPVPAPAPISAGTVTGGAAAGGGMAPAPSAEIALPPPAAPRMAEPVTERARAGDDAMLRMPAATADALSAPMAEFAGDVQAEAGAGEAAAVAASAAITAAPVGWSAVEAALRAGYLPAPARLDLAHLLSDLMPLPPANGAGPLGMQARLITQPWAPERPLLLVDIDGLRDLAGASVQLELLRGTATGVPQARAQAEAQAKAKASAVSETAVPRMPVLPRLDVEAPAPGQRRSLALALPPALLADGGTLQLIAGDAPPLSQPLPPALEGQEAELASVALGLGLRLQGRDPGPEASWAALTARLAAIPVQDANAGLAERKAMLERLIPLAEGLLR